MKTFLAIACLFTSATFSFAQPKTEKIALPPDLAAVPNDAFGFAHVKLADLWKNDALKDVRAILEKAGPKALEAFDSRFAPAPSSIERLTAYMLPINPEGPGDPNFVFILSVNKAFDRDKLLKQLGKTKARKGRVAGFIVDEDESIGVRFIDEKTIAFGTIDAIQHMVDNAPPEKAGPLTPALQLAATKRPIVVSLNVGALPADIVEEVLRGDVPEALHPLAKATSATLSMDLEGDGNVYAVVQYGDRESADAAEQAVGAALEMVKNLIAEARKELTEKAFGEGKDAKIEDFPLAAASLLGLGALQHAEDLLKANPVKRSGDTLSLSIKLPPQFKSLLSTAAVAGAMMTPAVGKLRESAARAQGANNLKQIALAMHNYEAANQTFPPAALVDKKGKPQLSWRVMILPYIEQDNLYKQFNLDEPWDSDNNKKLIDMMPKTYALPNKMSKPGETHYRVFVGNGAVFDWLQGSSFAKISDGTSNTWMVVEAADGVPWTKPDELEFDPKKPLPKLGKSFPGGFHVAMCDGSVRFIRESVAEATRKAMITKDGGEVVRE